MERVKYSDHSRQFHCMERVKYSDHSIDRFHCMERVKYSDHSRQVPLHGEGEIQ